MDTGIDTLKEQIPHGDALFPLMVHQLDTDSRFRERVRCHWHAEMEIMVVTKGRARVHVDDRSYTVDEGAVTIIMPNRLHSVTAQEGEPFSFYAVVFDMALLNSFAKDAIQQQYIDSARDGEVVFPECLTGEEPWKKEMDRLLSDIKDFFENRRQGYELFIKARLCEIWYVLYVHAGRQGAEADKNTEYKVRLTKQVMDYLQKHYAEQIVLDELARQFHISEGYLCRLFRSMTKRSVVEYVTDCRISVSARLLKESDMDIGQIAGRAGFNNISYFNRVFRRYMNMTPKEYRRTAR